MGTPARLGTCQFFLLAVLAASGCMEAKISESPPAKFEEGILAEMVGMNEAQVIERLGEPDWRYRMDQKGLFLYEGTGTSLQFAVIFFAPLIGEMTTNWCLLLEFDRLGLVEQAQAKNLGSDEQDCRASADVPWAKKVKAALFQSAMLGDREAAIELATRFNEPTPLKRLLRNLAEQGDREAANELARRFQEPGPLRKLAEHGDVATQYDLAQLNRPGSYEEWVWLCRAAKQGHPVAQAKIAGYFESGNGPVAIDLVKAYIWIQAAERNGFSANVQGYYRVDGGMACCATVSASGKIAEQLTPAQQAQVAELALKRWGEHCAF